MNTNSKVDFFFDKAKQWQKEFEKLRAIAYSMDLLIPGFYFWCPYFTIRIGGAIPDDNPYKYPGKIHSSTGIGIVLPGYKIFTRLNLNKSMQSQAQQFDRIFNASSPLHAKASSDK